MSDAGPPRLSDADVRERVARLDALLERLEQSAGPVAEVALETVETLTQVYGAALERVMEQVCTTPPLVASLSEDELVGHLLVLHGLHPRPVEERAARALEEVRPYVRSHGGDVELAGIESGVARVRLSGSCRGCPSSSATLQRVVSDAILGAAPELSGVEAAPVEPLPRLLLPLRRTAGGP
jgi:Fe-S cluster biogenesis protein NfuA